LFLKGKDVLGIAKTGSGKTASYVLPILTNLFGNTALKNRHVKVLVLVPTRELAMQVREVFVQFGIAFPEQIKSLAVYGGVAINPQMKALQNVSVLVATPGRLLELANSNAVHLSEIDTLVLDEADKLLQFGFEEEMKDIFTRLPQKRQNLLFSATLSDNVKNINQILLHNPLVIKIEPERDAVELINQTVYAVAEERKGPLLFMLLRKKEKVLCFVI